MNPSWGPFTLHATQCTLHFKKHQKNEIHSIYNKLEPSDASDVNINLGFLQSDSMSATSFPHCHCSKVSRKMRVNFYNFNLSAHIRFFAKVLIETNVNISKKLIFSHLYRSVNYIESLAKFT